MVKPEPIINSEDENYPTDFKIKENDKMTIQPKMPGKKIGVV